MRRVCRTSKFSFPLWLAVIAVFFAQPAGPANAGVVFQSGWEDGQALGHPDLIPYSRTVAGYYNSSSPPPECSRRQAANFRSGNYFLLIAGYSQTAYSYCYYRVFDVNLDIVSGTKLSYYIYHPSAESGTTRRQSEESATSANVMAGSCFRAYSPGLDPAEYGRKQGVGIDSSNARQPIPATESWWNRLSDASSPDDTLSVPALPSVLPAVIAR